MRDVFQIVSVVVGFLIIFSVFKRTKNAGERRRDWLPIIVISILTIVFYISVFIDQQHDIMNSSDVSSTLRLTSEVLILIFVRYFPPRIRL